MSSSRSRSGLIVVVDSRLPRLGRDLCAHWASSQAGAHSHSQLRPLRATRRPLSALGTGCCCVEGRQGEAFTFALTLLTKVSLSLKRSIAMASSSSSARQAYIHPTPSSAPPPPRPPLRRYFAPIFLLTTVVSLAFNRARLARDRSEEHRRHLVAYNILDDELRRLRRTQATSSRVTLDDAEEERAFASRCARAGIDILRLGIRPEALPEGYMLQRERMSAAASSPGASAPAVTWGQALFGGQGTVERLKEAVGRAAMSVRASFAGGSRDAQEGEGQSKATQQQEDEWEKGELAREGGSIDLSTS